MMRNNDAQIATCQMFGRSNTRGCRSTPKKTRKQNKHTNRAASAPQKRKPKNKNKNNKINLIHSAKFSGIKKDEKFYLNINCHFMEKNQKFYENGAPQ